MECAIGMADETIASPDFNLVGQTQYIMPHQIFKQNCQFILNMFTFVRDILRILQLLNYTVISSINSLHLIHSFL